MCILDKITTFAHVNQQGSLAEWLGTGLQNRLQQFESARNLKKTETLFLSFFVSYLFLSLLCFAHSLGISFAINFVQAEENKLQKTKRPRLNNVKFRSFCSESGNRTRVSTVRGWRARPLH